MSELTVAGHYSSEGMRGRVERSLVDAGLADRVDWRDVSPLDQFHVGGLAATQELGTKLHPEAGSRVLDVGCGLGGTARFLAGTYGCRVDGVDLSAPFVEIGKMLTERAGLRDLVYLQEGDALALPFGDESFDSAWTQHVAMNIRDRDGMYSEVYRVLKPGGRFAIHDIIAGNGEALTFPVPWAPVPEISFLLNESEMRATLVGAGFVVDSWEDQTEEALAWFGQMLAARDSGASKFNLSVVLGPEFAGRAANLAKDLREGRARVVQVVVGKRSSV